MFPIDRFTAGDSLNFSVPAFADDQGVSYNSGGYTLVFTMRGAKQLTASAVANGTGWKFSISPTTTAALTAGLYNWTLTASATGVRYTAESGSITVDADLTAVITDGYDGRSLARKSLDDAEAALANITASGARTHEYTIGDRAAKYYTPAELIAAISYWRIRVANEARAHASQNGLADPTQRFVRFR